MELNGLANMKIRISRLADKGAIPAEDAMDLLRMADEFDKYLVAYHENPSVQWHEIKANPGGFMTRGEQVDYFNKVWKMPDAAFGQELLDVIPQGHAIGLTTILADGKELSEFVPLQHLEGTTVSLLRDNIGKNAELPLKTRMKAAILADEIERRCKHKPGE